MAFEVGADDDGAQQARRGECGCTAHAVLTHGCYALTHLSLEQYRLSMSSRGHR